MMSEQPARVSLREITDFLNHLRTHRPATHDHAPSAAASRLDLLAWKASILARIAAQTTDVETRAVAAAARAELAAARAEESAAHAEEVANSFRVLGGGER
ncbi:hypothetical protein HNR23_004762 [Nocardiopsis mwathae]|uniref:Uncharacterized protein n=1 Tax=Nocardiopsis mwathae TaxID=1472723 RepID=A0A7W9YM58_9ACTN|nr:hypothetical protein [Nocardiopsis mwathae]MBB6174702.1 hypothetical protein [Nocardiopsis mwathae]